VHEIQPEIAAALPRMKLESAMPAFSNCSLDNNPGNGDPADGDFVGQINGYLLWDDGDCADQPHRWEMTVWVVKGCPDDRCTVDVTPRHCKAFKPKPAERFKWTNTSIAENNTIDSGDVAADKFGLVTLPQVTVTKGRNRLAIERIK
jgi:hypothetical protein